MVGEYEYPLHIHCVHLTPPLHFIPEDLAIY